MGISQTPQAIVPAAFTSGGMTVLASGSLSGTSTTISSIPATYTNLVLVVRDFFTVNSSELYLRCNGNSTGGVHGSGWMSMGSTSITNQASGQQQVNTPLTRTSDNNTFAYFEIFDYTNSMNKKGMFYTQTELQNDNRNAMGHFYVNITSAINSVTFLSANSDSFSGGTYIIYGVK